MRARQRQIEQHERAIRMPRKRGQRLLAIDRCQHIERAMEMRKRMCERLLDQRVIVDDQYLQGGSPFRGVVRFCGARREIYGEAELAQSCQFWQRRERNSMTCAGERTLLVNRR